MSKTEAPKAPRAKPKKKAAAKRLDDARARMYQELIFESAECVFGEKGFEGATMQDIASEAGVSLKTVYSSYPGKQELYGAIMHARGRETLEAVDAARAAASGPTEKLIAGTRAFVHYLFEHGDWMRINARSRLSWAIRPEDELAAKLWDEGQRGHRELLSEGIELGVFCDEEPLETALMINALTRVQVAHAIGQGETDADAVADRLIPRILRMVCRDGVELREAG